jgi:hypothetical protein
MLRIVMLGLAAAAGDKTITQVVHLLNGMMEKSKADGENDRLLFAKFKCYCDTTKANKSAAIENHEATIASLNADIEDRTAQSERLNEGVAELLKDMSANNGTRSTANAQRSRENLDFEAEEADMISGITQLERALGLLNAIEPASFLQRRDAASALRAAAEYFPKHQEKLLQMAKAPASGIAGVLWTFNETMGWNLGALRTTEANALADYERLNATLSKEYADMDEIKRAKEVELADHEDEIAKATTERDASQTSKDSDESFVSSLVARCDEKAAEYQRRNELRSQENMAVSQAIAILDSDAAFATFGAAKATSTGATSAMFLQESVRRTKGHKKASADVQAVTQTVTAVLERAAKDSGSLRMAKLAAKVSVGGQGLHNVDDSLHKMIKVIDREEAKDTATLAVCESEQTGGGEDKEAKESALSTLNQTINTLNTGIKDSIKSLEDNNASLASNRESQTTETADRGTENAACIKNVANLEEAEKILTKSIEVLTKYYDYLHRANADITYTEHSGKDSLGGNTERLPIASQEELEEACTKDPACLGFTSEGWLKSAVAPEDEWIDVGYNLYTKTAETAAHAALLQEEPDTWGEEAEGQREQGAEVLNMLRYILSETTKEREDAIKDEETAVTDFNTTMTGLISDEATLVQTISELETTLADQKQSLQEAEEDEKVTAKQLGMITAYLEKILPGCTWMQDNYDARAQGRADEKAGLLEAVDQIEHSPSYEAEEQEVIDAQKEGPPVGE